jgi:hypothetical protein
VDGGWLIRLRALRRDLPSSAAFAKATASYGLRHGKQDGVPGAKSGDQRLRTAFDSCAPAHLKLAPSPTRSLLPSQFYLLCRFSKKLHSTSRFCPSMSLAPPRLHSPTCSTTFEACRISKPTTPPSYPKSAITPGRISSLSSIGVAAIIPSAEARARFSCTAKNEFVSLTRPDEQKVVGIMADGDCARFA